MVSRPGNNNNLSKNLIFFAVFFELLLKINIYNIGQYQGYKYNSGKKAIEYLSNWEKFLGNRLFLWEVLLLF
jgi:hypothetical protein